MTILAALAIGLALGWFLTRILARIGLRNDALLINVLDGLTLTQLNKLRDAADREIKTRIRQAQEEAA